MIRRSLGIVRGTSRRYSLGRKSTGRKSTDSVSSNRTPTVLSEVTSSVLS